MIIEIHSPQVDNILFTAWEIPEYAWENRKDFIMKLFHKYFDKYNVPFSEDEWQNNIIFKLNGTENDFSKIEKLFDKYFSSIKVLNMVT